MEHTTKEDEHGPARKDQLSSDLKAIIEDAEALLQATSDDRGEDAASARRKMRDALDRAKTSFSGVENRAIAQAKATDEIIRSHPYETLGIAFGVGLLIGLMVNRR